jgi:DNA-binding NarL/FixJ family response regulator
MGASGTERPVRVVLVDAREERRALMVAVVEGDGDRAVVVAEADSPLAAICAVGQEQADAVVLDLCMPIPIGLLTVRKIRRSFPTVAVVVCSFDLDPATVAEALAAGADACLAKPASPYQLGNALAGARRRPQAAVASPTAA